MKYTIIPYVNNMQYGIRLASYNGDWVIEKQLFELFKVKWSES